MPVGQLPRLSSSVGRWHSNRHWPRQLTASVDGTPQNGANARIQSHVPADWRCRWRARRLAPRTAAPNQSLIGTARKLLTDNTGVLQVADSSITLLRQELRETNALLLLILQALAGGDALDIKGGVVPAHLPIQ